MKRKILAILKYVITLTIAFSLLAYAFRKVSVTDMIAQLGTVNFGWIYLSVGLSLLSHVLRAYRWQILLQPLNYRVPLSTSFWAVMIGYLANLAFPRMGEITKCGVIKRTDGVRMSASMGTVVTERIMDVVALLIIMFFTFLVEFDRLNTFFIGIFQEKLPENSLWFITQVVLVALGIALVIGLILIRYRSRIMTTGLFQKIKTSVINFKDGLLSIRKIRNINGFILSSIGIWFLYYLMAYVIVFSIPETSGLDWIAGMAILVVGGVAMSAPVQGGIGTYHILVGALLTLYSVSQETGVFFATLLHTSQTLSVMTFGTLGLIIISLTRRRFNQTDEIIRE